MFLLTFSEALVQYKHRFLTPKLFQNLILIHVLVSRVLFQNSSIILIALPSFPALQISDLKYSNVDWNCNTSNTIEVLTNTISRPSAKGNISIRRSVADTSKSLRIEFFGIRINFVIVVNAIRKNYYFSSFWYYCAF